MARRLVSLILVAVAAGAGAWWFLYGRWEHRYDSLIADAARRYQVPPSVVKAVIWKESRFRAGVRGRHAELGLMQLQEDPAQNWASSTNFVFEHMLDPGTNILAGSYTLARLFRRYSRTDQPWVYTLADYNAGRGNVLRWMKGPAETNAAAFLEAITFPSTRQYVHDILERRSRYESDFR